MPWYFNSVTTCKALNKIVSCSEISGLQDLRSVLDHATELIWRIQKHFYESSQHKGGDL